LAFLVVPGVSGIPNLCYPRYVVGDPFVNYVVGSQSILLWGLRAWYYWLFSTIRSCLVGELW